MWKKLSNITKILVPVDLSDASLCAVEAALTLSREKKSQICLIHVITASPARAALGAPGTVADAEAETRRKYAAMEEFFQKKVKHQSRFAFIVRKGIPADEILTFAREEGVDVIVLPVGADEPGGPVRAGGTADQVVRNATVPVMVVKPESLTRKIEGAAMACDERYLQEIRQRVCAKCIDRTSSGLCVATAYESCAINRYLPEIIEIVLTTEGAEPGACVAKLRERVCSVCLHQSPDGRCDLRDDVECALDRYFPMVVEAIREVHPPH